MVWPGGLLLINLSMQVLKPNGGFGAVTASLPVIIWLLSRRRSPLNRVAPIAAALAIYLAAVFVPQQVLGRSDADSPLFVWKTLFLWHAPAIDEEIAADLRSHADIPDRELLVQLHELIRSEFAFARDHPDQVGYATLGYNPDRLLYESPLSGLVAKVFDHDVERQASFYRHYYVRVWLNQTGWMLNKVIGQLGFFYGRAKVIYRSYGDTWSQKARLEGATRDMELYLGPDAAPGVARGAAASPLYRDFWRVCQDHARASTLVVSTPRPLVRAVRAVRWSYTSILCVCLLLAGAWWVLRNRIPDALGSGFPLLLAIAFYTHNFGHNLTYAVVHSMDVPRYQMTQLMPTVVSHAFGGVVVVSALVGLWHFLWHYRSRAGQRGQPAGDTTLSHP